MIVSQRVFVIVSLLCVFGAVHCAISPEIELTSAVQSAVANSTCVDEAFTITSPYGITGLDANCSEDHNTELLLDGNEETWWQSMNQDENVTLNFNFNDFFVLTGAQLVFRSPLPQLLLVQFFLNGTLVDTLAYAADNGCDILNYTCAPLNSIVNYEENCTDVSTCPPSVNVTFTIMNVTADSISYIFSNMVSDLSDDPMSQYYAISEADVYGYIPTNYYFNSLHFISAEAEDGMVDLDNVPVPLFNTAVPDFSGDGYTIINTDSQTPFIWTISILKNSTYQLVLRYANTSDLMETTPLVTTLSRSNDGPRLRYRFFIEGCDMVWCYALGVGLDDTTTAAAYQLVAGQWNIRATMDVTNLKLDVFIALPEEFYNPVSLGLAAAERFNMECGLVTNTLGRGTPSEHFCYQNTFVLSYGFTPTLFGCSCHPNGSLEQCCDPRGGQCPCTSPVGTNIQPYGLDCNTCPSYFYGPTNTGCIECNCTNNAQCDVNTGQCPCPDLVSGRQCTECVPNAFGDPASRCFSCACDVTGTELCNSTNGDCECRPYYTGERCDRCFDDAFNDSLVGCLPCECDPVGSTNQSCSSTGECNCKSSVAGLKCTTCERAAFHLSDTGCIECWCNGLNGVECSSSIGSYATVDVVSSTDNSSEGWSLVVVEGDQIISTMIEISLEDYNATTVLTANISNINSSVPVYWSVPSAYINMNWLLAYGGNLTVQTSRGDGMINLDTASGSGIGSGLGSGLGSMYSSYGIYLISSGTSLVYEVNPSVNIAAITVPLIEDAWMDVSTGRPATRPVLLSVLANLNSILIPAVPADSTITIIRLGLFQYDNSSAEGTDRIPVENCSCPLGNTGRSCQECIAGYFMSSSGQCVPCQCNNRSNDCNPVTGECLNCQANTTGPNCEQCLPCYVNITSGPTYACMACGCLQTGCRNCSIDALFGEEQCACLTGYTGERCDMCADGYFSPPLSDQCILSCGECVDKLVMLHNESAQQANTLADRLEILDDLSMIYQHLSGIISQAQSLMGAVNNSMAVQQQLMGDLTMIDTSREEVANLSTQVDNLWQQVEDIGNQIRNIPDYTDDTAAAMSLYTNVSVFNVTVFTILDQLESLSIRANVLLMNLTTIVADNAETYTDEVNRALQILQNATREQADAANVERVANTHLQILYNISSELQVLMTGVLDLDDQVQTLNMSTNDLYQLVIDLQELRIRTMALVTSVNNSYEEATNVLDSARTLYSTAASLEQNISTQLQVLIVRLADTAASSGSGSGDEGGEVVQELSGLQSAIDGLRSLFMIVNSTVVNADMHTDNLTDNATTISGILDPILSQEPAEIVRNFSSLLIMIEEATNLSIQANESISQTLQQVMQLISEGLTDRAIQLYNMSQRLSSQLVALNTSLEMTQGVVNQARMEALVSRQLRNETHDSVMSTLNRVSQLQIASRTSQSQVNMLLTSISSSLQCVNNTLESQLCEVPGQLGERLNGVEDILMNSSLLLAGANNSLLDASAAIVDRTSAIPTIRNVSAGNDQLIGQLNDSVQALQQRVTAARMALASIAVALRLVGNQTYSYSLPSLTNTNDQHTQFSIIFRTSEPNGTLLYTNNLMEQCVSLGLVNRQVVFSFALDTNPVVITNPLAIDDDVWYHVFATRDEELGRLSVTQLQNVTTVTAEESRLTNTSTISLMDDVYVGGTSATSTDVCTSVEHFTGCVGSVIVNSQPVPLLAPNEGLELVVLPCGPHPPEESPRMFDSSTWLMGSDSYIKLPWGPQSTTVFRLMMGFRTVNPNGILFYSPGRGRSVTVLLLDGRVVYWTSTPPLDACIVETSEQYNDGDWHYLTAIYSTAECSINVDGEVRNNSVASELSLPAPNSDVYIGGAPTFMSSASPFISFAGCVRDVVIGTTMRNLTVNQGTLRVDFNGCPVEVELGVRFNGEGFAVLPTAEDSGTHLTEVVFSFKTIQVTGLLLILGQEDNIIISLYHGYVRLEHRFNNTITVLETSSSGYNDNLWHVLSVRFADNMITMMVHTDSVSSQPGPAIFLPTQLTVGGSTENTSHSDVAISYRGCIRDLTINNQTYNFHNAIVLMGVSLFGCRPAAEIPPIPSTTIDTMTTTVLPSTSSVPSMTPTVSTMLPSLMTDSFIVEPTPEMTTGPVVIITSTMTSTPVMTATVTPNITTTPFMTTTTMPTATTDVMATTTTTIDVMATATIDIMPTTTTTTIDVVPTTTTVPTATVDIMPVPTTISDVVPTTTTMPTTTSDVVPTTTTMPTTTSDVVPTTTTMPTTTSDVVPTTTSDVVPTTTSDVVPTTTSDVVPTTTSDVVPTTTTSDIVPTTTTMPTTTTSDVVPTTTTMPTTTSDVMATATIDIMPTTTTTIDVVPTTTTVPTTTVEIMPVPTTTSDVVPTTTVDIVPTSTTTPSPTPQPLLVGLNGTDGFIALMQPDIRLRYNIQLLFQTQSFNGILMYTENPLNGDYLAVYLRDGLLTYSRDLGGAETNRIVQSNQTYSDGMLHNFTVVRSGHISVITIDNGVEVLSLITDPSSTDLDIDSANNFYVGGVPSTIIPHAILQQDEASFPSVEACFTSLVINGDMVDLTNNVGSRGIIFCDEEILLPEVATFTGNGSYALLFEPFSPTTDFRLALSFRSSEADCNGLLTYIGNTSLPDYLALELVDGAVQLSFDNGDGITAVQYNRPNVNFCDGNWYQLEVVTTSLTVRLIVNGNEIEMTSSAFSSFISANSSKSFYIGGINNAVGTPQNVMFMPFRGCIRNLMLFRSGETMQDLISNSVERVNVDLTGCTI